MKTLAVAGLVALTACGSAKTGSNSSGSGTGGSSGGSGTTTGGCAQGLCGNVCCSSSAICVSDSTGNPTCATTCTTSSNCTANSPPCCQTAALANGKYASTGVCIDGVAGATTCLCSTSGECPPDTECVPLLKRGATPFTGVFTGPYLCTLDDGRSFDGCASAFCDQPTQDCARDKRGNLFCSDPCSADADCGNPGVACCNTTSDAGLPCCGLCGH